MNPTALPCDDVKRVIARCDRQAKGGLPVDPRLLAQANGGGKFALRRAGAQWETRDQSVSDRQSELVLNLSLERFPRQATLEPMSA